jgi:hypothetical protein
MGNGVVPNQVTEEIVRFASNFDDAVQIAFGPEIFVEGVSLRRSNRPPSSIPPPLPLDRK